MIKYRSDGDVAVEDLTWSLVEGLTDYQGLNNDELKFIDECDSRAKKHIGKIEKERDEYRACILEIHATWIEVAFLGRWELTGRAARLLRHYAKLIREGKV